MFSQIFTIFKLEKFEIILHLDGIVHIWNRVPPKKKHNCDLS